MAMTTAQQLRLLVEVRWQIFRNSLRSSKKQIALILGITGALMASLGVLAGAGGFFAAAFFAAQRGRPLLTGIMLLVITLLWQVAPLLLEITAPTLNFKEIARYPVSFRTYYLLHMAYGLFDPTVLVGLLWLAALWLGTAVGRFAWAPRALLLFVLFGVSNLLFSRWVLAIIERLLGTRRGREAAFVLVIGLMVASQFMAYGAFPRMNRTNAAGIVVVITPIWHWSPPGLASSGLADGGAGLALDLLALAAYCAVPALLLRSRLRANFLGETLTDAKRSAGAVQVEPGWSIPFLHNRLSTIFEKELRYALRDKRTIINMISPLIMVVLVVTSRGAFLRGFNRGLGSFSSFLPIALSVMCVLFLSNLAYNSCGPDGGGFPRWALSPVSARDVLLGKNLAIASLCAVTFTVVNIALAAVGSLPITLFPLILMGVIYGELMLFSIGNQFSVRFPVKFRMESVTSKNISQVAALGGLAFQGAVGASIWFLAGTSRMLGLPWLLPAGLAALVVIGFLIYRASLNNAAKYLEEHVEQISEELRPA